MRTVPPFAKALLTLAGVLFAAATVLYSALWMYDARWRPKVELGFDEQFVGSGHYELVTHVRTDSPAERAGLRHDDRIVRIDGRPLRDGDSLGDEWARHKPGDSVRLTIQRPGVAVPFDLRGTFRATGPESTEGVGRLGLDITGTYPIAFLAVGLAVLFLRIDDKNAWLLALLFAGFIGIAPFSNNSAGLSPYLRTFVIVYRAIFDGMFAALFYFFFAIFPARSPLDRRLPWLKWAALAIGVCAALVPFSEARRTFVAPLLYGLVVLGFVSLIGNAITAGTPDARRKIRVILWGAVVGVVPAVLMLATNDFLRIQAPLWLLAPVIVLLWLFPLSFAYAVVKHRVLEIPVLLKRSARYLLVQRGFLFLHLAISAAAAVLFAWALVRTRLLTPAGLTGGVAFGSVLALGGLRIHKTASERIDRAFFRNAYDARLIMEDLAHKTRTATNRAELAALLDEHLVEALRPNSLAIYLEASDARLSAERGRVPPELQTISVADPALVAVARYGRPRDVSQEELRSGFSPLSALSPLQPECLVPMLGRDSRLVGLLVLGTRLSEEPYSREDHQLLASVASQAGLALESIRLGEQIAERIEVERRAAQEMQFAREVQARLFPQKTPALRTLDYAGGCVQARQVGGDYYDFLELRPGRVALVLADVAGKGVSGALLMANLQANLRSQYALALEDLPRLLGSVNHLFYENTADNSYATLFFADYDNSTRRLRYINCGHLPPLLLRAAPACDGAGAHLRAVEHLGPTSTVLGLFDDWQCVSAEVQLAPGDILMLYTDGVTEAPNAEGEEFGESRLIETLRCHRGLPVASLLATVERAVQQFSGAEQADDITVVVARCTG